MNDDRLLAASFQHKDERHQVKRAGGRFKTPRRSPSHAAAGAVQWDTSAHNTGGTAKQYASKKRQDELRRDTWKQQQKTYSDRAQAADLPGWSIHRDTSPHTSPVPFWAMLSGQLTSFIITTMQLLVDEV